MVHMFKAMNKATAAQKALEKENYKEKAVVLTLNASWMPSGKTYDPTSG